MERGEEGEGRKGRDRVYVWVRDERERERENISERENAVCKEQAYIPLCQTHTTRANTRKKS